MIIIGGIDPSQIQQIPIFGQNNWAGIADPWSQGIGVFDMKTLEWKDSYDAEPVGYEAPDMVKQYYAKYELHI